MGDVISTIIVPILAAILIGILSRWDLVLRFKPEFSSRWAALRFLRRRSPNLEMIFARLNGALSNRQSGAIEGSFFLAPLIIGVGAAIYTNLRFGSSTFLLTVGLVSATILSNAIRFVAHRAEPKLPKSIDSPRDAWAASSVGYRVIRGCAVLQALVLAYVAIGMAAALAQHGMSLLWSPTFPNTEYVALVAFNTYNVFGSYSLESRQIEDSAYRRLLAGDSGGLRIEAYVDGRHEGTSARLRGVRRSIGGRATVRRDDGFEEDVPWSSIMRLAAPADSGTANQPEAPRYVA